LRERIAERAANPTPRGALGRIISSLAEACQEDFILAPLVY
jgi:hypothetical protein